MNEEILAEKEPINPDAPLFEKLMQKKQVPEEGDRNVREDYKNSEIYYLKNTLKGVDATNVLEEMKKLNPIDARAYETGRDENYLRNRLSQLVSEPVSKITQDPEIIEGDEFFIGNSKFNTTQNVIVKRSNGDIENDWHVIGMSWDYGKKSVTIRKEENGQTLLKKIPEEEFLSWQKQDNELIKEKMLASVSETPVPESVLESVVGSNSTPLPTELKLQSEELQMQELQTKPELQPQSQAQKQSVVEIPFDGQKYMQEQIAAQKAQQEQSQPTEQPTIDLVIEPAPVAVEPEPQPQSQPQNQTEAMVKTEKDISEWQEFEILRNELAKLEMYLKKNKPTNETEAKKLEDELNDRRFVYEEQRKKIAESIIEQTRKELNLTPDSPLAPEASAVANEQIFETLVVKENEAYIAALKTARGETLGDKVKEGLKNALSSKAVQWYLKQNKWVRLGATSALVAGIGWAVGTVAATGAVGYAGARYVRGAASFGGAALGKTIAENKKSWSVEEIEKEAQTKTEDLKTDLDKTLTQKAQEYAKLSSESEKEKRNARLKKVALTVGLGAGTGLLSGLSEHLFAGSNGSAASASENANAPKPDAVPADVSPEKIFSNESMLHEVKVGDSVWKILEKTLDNNDKFKGMSEAQKTYVLSALTNKAMQSPQDYMIGENGTLNVGDKTNFAKLFEDSKEINSIFDKAVQIKSGSPQEVSILENNRKISEWVKNNPGKKLNESVVSDILSAKPKVEVAAEVATEPVSKLQMPNQLEAEELTKAGMAGSETVAMPKPEPIQPIAPLPTQAVPEALGMNQDIPNKIPESEIGGAKMAAGGVAMAAAPVVSMKSFRDYKRENLENEIKAAQDRLNVLEQNQIAKNTGGIIKNPNLERSYASDKKIFYSERDFLERAKKAFENETDRIYGQKGLFKSIKGIDTKEYKEISGLPASNIVKYCTGDSQNSGLSALIVEKISKSDKHNEFLKQIIGLLEQTNGEIKPFENENTGQFFKRLGEFVLKKYMLGQKIAA